MTRFFKRRGSRRVLVLGLDCAAPELVFDQFNAELPTLRGLMQTGTWGRLESSIPCITVPAWASMMSSRDPGVLGIYGFRNRADHSYNPMKVTDGSAVHVPRVWDYVSEAGRPSLLVGVPQTYPPRPLLNGYLVSDFMTPGTESAFTYPAILKQEVLRVTPNYTFDVGDFRTPDKDALWQRLIDMTEAQYRLLCHLMTGKAWDFAMHVNIGTDRVHHGFWRYHDSTHRLYEAGNPYEHYIRDYYKLVDERLAEVIELAGDDVTVLVVSDHGVRRLDGGICLNEWLWRNGWLTLKTPPQEGELTTFENADVDWAQTRAWGSGGYYGRVFLNVEEREPRGIIPAEQYEATRNELAAALATITGPNDQALDTKVFKPQEIYQQVNGIAPDLLVYFGDLHWRAVGTFGHGAHFTLENDTGPDDANHAPHGIFILNEPGKRGAGNVDGHQLMDIAPTLLRRLGIDVPREMQGREIET